MLTPKVVLSLALVALVAIVSAPVSTFALQVTQTYQVTLKAKTIFGQGLPGIAITVDSRIYTAPVSLSLSGSHSFAVGVINGTLYSFLRWEDETGAVISALSAFKYNIASTKTLYAVFRPTGDPAPASVISWLHTQGTNTFDEQGQQVKLYGANLGWGSGDGISLSDMQELKSLGFNTLRILMPWGRLQPKNETMAGVDASYFNAGTSKFPLYHGLDDVVNWAVQQNIYLTLGIYWSTSEPPPSWAFKGISNDSQRYEALIKGTATKERAGFANLWKYIATRYRNIPNVVFELLNEPNVPDNDASKIGSYYKAFNEAIISAIESVETRSHLKLVQFLLTANAWQEILDGSMDTSKPNVAWASHYYSPATNWDPNGKYWQGSYTWNGQTYPEGWANGASYVTSRLSTVGNWIQARNKPWIITEFAKDTTQTYWKDWYNDVLGTVVPYDPTGLVVHLYTRNPGFESGWNINNPTTQQDVMGRLTLYVYDFP
jgi:hypothetical protein